MTFPNHFRKCFSASCTYRLHGKVQVGNDQEKAQENMVLGQQASFTSEYARTPQKHADQGIFTPS